MTVHDGSLGITWDRMSLIGGFGRYIQGVLEKVTFSTINSGTKGPFFGTLCTFIQNQDIFAISRDPLDLIHVINVIFIWWETFLNPSHSLVWTLS